MGDNETVEVEFTEVPRDDLRKAYRDFDGDTYVGHSRHGDVVIRGDGFEDEDVEVLNTETKEREFTSLETVKEVLSESKDYSVKKGVLYNKSYTRPDKTVGLAEVDWKHYKGYAIAHGHGIGTCLVDVERLKDACETFIEEYGYTDTSSPVAMLTTSYDNVVVLGDAKDASNRAAVLAPRSEGKWSDDIDHPVDE